MRPGHTVVINNFVWRAWLAMGLLLGSLLFLSCAGSPPEKEQSDASHVRGGVLRMIQEAPRTLDPMLGDSVYESLPVNQIFDTLVDFDPSLNLKPALAETWTISRDGLVYTFTLREGVRFHDGQMLQASDVAFSVLRNLRPGDEVRSLAFSSLLVIEGARDHVEGRRENVPGIRVVDGRTVEFRLAKPYNSFLELLAMDSLAVVPERALLEMGEEAFGRAPLGTGPFRFSAWSDSALSLEANPDYYRGQPYLDGVAITFLTEDDTDFGAARFFDHKLDVLEPPTESLERLAGDSDVRLHRYQQMSLSFLGLGTSQPPLDKRWLRQAIGHAINRQGMIEESPSVRREAAGMLPPGLTGYSPEPKGLDYDPEASRSLLAKAGYPGGRGLPAVKICNPSMGPSAQRVLERIRTDLEAVGIRLEVVDVTWPELGEMLEGRTVPAFLLAWLADRTDPDAFLRALFETNGSANYFGYASEKVDDLLDRGADEKNPQLRARIYRELEREILADAPMVPMYHTMGVVALRANVHGLEPTPLGLAKAELEEVWIDRAEGQS